MNLQELKSLVQQAISMLRTRDAYLLDTGAAEWTIAHRLAVYLEGLLPGWDIDCEYNRQVVQETPKALAMGARIRPDIVVHHRGRPEREHNLLAVELKKSRSQSDLIRLREYTMPPDGERKFQYKYGLALTMNGGLDMTWFENGCETT
jgi:hypothetical protein